MRPILPLALLSAALLPFAALPVGAQETPPPPPNSPVVAAANDQVSAEVQAKDAAQGAAQLDAQAQYAADLAAYDASVRAHRRAVTRTAVEDERRRAAYADAMRAWRSQVYACHHGSTAACRAPSPDPAAFY